MIIVSTLQIKSMKLRRFSDWPKVTQSWDSDLNVLLQWPSCLYLDEEGQGQVSPFLAEQPSATHNIPQGLSFHTQMVHQRNFLNKENSVSTRDPEARC